MDEDYADKSSVATISSFPEEIKERRRFSLSVPTIYSVWSEILGVSYLIEESENASNKSIWKSYVHLTVFHVYCIYQFLLALEDILENRNIWYNLLSLSQLTVSLITIDVLVCRRKRLRKIYVSFYRLMDESDVQNLRSSHQQEQILVVSVLSFLFVYTLIFSITVTRFKVAILDDNFIPFVNVPIEQPELVLILIIFDWLLFVIYVLSTLAYCILLFCFYCNRLCYLFDYLNSKISFANSDRLIKQLAVEYDRMNQLTSDMDNAFGTAVFTWFAVFISAVCTEVSTILTGEVGLTYKGSPTIIILDFVYYSSIILIACDCGSRVSISAQNIIPNLVKAIHVNRLTSQSLYNDVLLLTSRQICCPVVLTAGNFFTLSRGLLLTLIGVTLSYVIFLFQINSNTMKSFINATDV